MASVELKLCLSHVRRLSTCQRPGEDDSVSLRQLTDPWHLDPGSMSSNLTTDCEPDDHLCIVREHDLAVIIVPTLLLFFTLVTLLGVCIARYCPERKQAQTAAPERSHRSHHRHTQRHRHRRNLQGIDAPPGINPLEHEALPMSVQQVQQNVKPIPPAVPNRSTERHHGAFSQINALPMSFSIKPNDTVSLYRARMDNRNVILRVLKTASSADKKRFLGFASFLSRLGPHPFLPALLGVVSVQSPLVMVVEELQHRDLLGYLWRCRQDHTGIESSCDMTEMRIFTMARQVASALEYLHVQQYIHGNVGARSILVGGDQTAKLWGLGSAYRRKAQEDAPEAVEDMELKKWQAPEVLSRRTISPSSDVWSFGILLYEMVTLGDPPFAELMATELLQYLQRGKHLKKPPNCSNTLYSIIRSCSQWNPQHRLSMSELIRKLQAGEVPANGRTILRVPEPLDIEKYMREAGYGEAYNYAVL